MGQGVRDRSRLSALISIAVEQDPRWLAELVKQLEAAAGPESAWLLAGDEAARLRIVLMARGRAAVVDVESGEAPAVVTLSKMPAEWHATMKELLATGAAALFVDREDPPGAAALERARPLIALAQQPPPGRRRLSADEHQLNTLLSMEMNNARRQMDATAGQPEFDRWMRLRRHFNGLLIELGKKTGGGRPPRFSVDDVIAGEDLREPDAAECAAGRGIALSNDDHGGAIARAEAALLELHEAVKAIPARDVAGPR